jgi:eukaryotic-like serine/threonine-protein kinase
MLPQSGSRRAFAMPFEPGEILGGKYEVIELIGVGCIGFVVSAKRCALGDEVALKFLRPEYLANQDLVARFAREARVAVRIKSEHVARVFDVGSLRNGTPFIVMERLEGRDLSELIELGPLPVPMAVEYVLQVCEALATAHAAGVVHRDIKPENLFLTRLVNGNEIVKVLDFGISKLALAASTSENRMPLVRTTIALGSPVYMSPEQIRASENIDARADIWALGAVLYELLAGTVAFDAPSLLQICALILENDPVPLRTIDPSVPPELEAAVNRCLNKEPEARFQSVAELATALRPFAPERAHGLVQRCCYVLKEDERLDIEVEPPGFPSATSTGPAGGLAVSIRASSAQPLEAPPQMARSAGVLRTIAIGALLAGGLAGFYGLRKSVQVDAVAATATAAPAPAPVAAAEPPVPSPSMNEAPVPSPSMNEPPVVSATPPASAPPPVVTVARPIGIQAASARSAASKEGPRSMINRRDRIESLERAQSEPDVGF